MIAFGEQTGVRERARSLGLRMAAEDGVGFAVRAIDRLSRGFDRAR